MISLAKFAPTELGLPGTLEDRFHDCQVEAVDWARECERRVRGMALPTGSGKTWVALALAKMTGLRTVILTATKGLQQQYIDMAGETGLVDIRGKANYECNRKTNLNCRSGQSEGCELAGKYGCTYECAKGRAKDAQIVLTNYAYWVRVNEYTRGLEYTEKEGDRRPVELLVCDEGHHLIERLSQAMRVTLRETWLRAAIGQDRAVLRTPAENDPMADWQDFAFDNLRIAEEMLKGAIARLRIKPGKQARDRVYAIEETVEALTKIQRMNFTDWVVESRQGTSFGRLWDFDCVWPAQFAESRLFLGVPNIVVMSATLRPVTLKLLGLKEEDYEFREWPRVFPAQNTPVYHIPTVRMNHRVTESELGVWIRTIEDIAAPRRMWKGLIDTVSYDRQRYLLGHWHFDGKIFANTNDPDSDSAWRVAEDFRNAEPPAVLVSPSFSTGWDFKQSQCRWIIATKVPYPDTRSAVMQARIKEFKRYPSMVAMFTLAQLSQRGTREETDWCEVFIVDDSITWFMKQNQDFKPSWFRVRTVSGVPAPLNRVEVVS